MKFISFMTSAHLNVDLTSVNSFENCSSIDGLSNTVCRLSLGCLVFEILSKEGGKAPRANN